MARVKHPARRTRGRQSGRSPRFPRGAELVLKETWEVDGTRDHDVPLPCILILGNKQGYRYLAQYFAWMATRDATPVSESWGDPDNHVQFNGIGWNEPFDQTLSDRVTFRLGTLNKRNRAAAFEKYQVSPATAQRGNAIARYERRIAEMRSAPAVSTTVGTGRV